MLKMSNSSLKPFKETVSLCPECYRRIPALIHLSDAGATMQKICTDHGEFISMVERDVNFYLQCMKANAPTIYAGYFIDVTEKCNLVCKYCYFPVNNKKKDKSIDSIVQDAFLHRSMAPFILTGGEPTLRSDLPEIIEKLKPIGPVELLTNGTGLCEDLLEKILPVLSINLSIHDEIFEDNLRVLKLFEDRKIKLESVLFVIDDVNEIDELINLCDGWKHVICSTRIKAATKVWNEQKPKEKIFVSDIAKYLTETYDAEPVWWRNNKVSFFNLELNGIIHMPVSWYDRFNIDMLDINCAPYYQAKTGETMNFLTSMLINEGIDKGWLNGHRCSYNNAA